LQPPAAIPYGTGVAYAQNHSKTGFVAAVAIRLATSGCNPAKHERRSITNSFLRAAVPLSFVIQTRHQVGPEIAHAQIRDWSEASAVVFRLLLIELSLQPPAHSPNLISQKQPQRKDEGTESSSREPRKRRNTDPPLVTPLPLFHKQIHKLRACYFM